MTNRDKIDEINKTNSNDGRFLEDAKAKLRWYTSEASEDEFDEEAVAGLVTYIAALEKTDSEKETDEERLKERFNAYCNLYKNQEEYRKTLKSYKGSQELLMKKNSGKIKSFGKKGIVVTVAAACILLLIITGSARDLVNAGEDSGFFHWLKKDKEGILAVTSPENAGLSAEEKCENKYSRIEDAPEVYQQYLVEKEDFSLLSDFEFQSVECMEIGSICEIREKFISKEGKKEIRIGVLVYVDATMIARDKFVDYEFLYTNMIEGRKQEIYKKIEKSGDIKYLVSFYQGNKKYFVSGNEDIEFLEAISKEYMDIIF